MSTMRLVFLLALFVSTASFAQYSGPAVNSCLAFAKRELAQSGAKAKDVVFDQDASLNIERYTRKIGSQFVSSVLTGNGAVVLEGSPSAELSFICLLADEKRPVFFWWLPRQGMSALAQCTRSEALRKQARPCLQFLKEVADQDLGQLYAVGLQDARARGVDVVEAHRKANAEWLEYREAECSRRASMWAGDADRQDFRVACEIDLTRRRLLDMKP